MKRELLTLAVLLIVTTSLATAPVGAAEDPRIETYTPQETVSPGGTTQFTVQLLNDADEVDDQVKPARNVKATVLDDRTPFTVPDGTQLLGVLENERPVPYRFALTVPRDIDPGTYHLPIEVTYDYDLDERETETVYATVRIEDRASFTLVDVESDLNAGETDSVALTLRNDGSKNAADATVKLQSQTSNVVFGTSPSTASFVGPWAPNETKTVTVEASAPGGTDVDTYPVTTTVSYDDTDGMERRSFPMTAGVSVGPAADRFDISNVTHSLRVGEEGATSMTLTNDGETVTDAVLTLRQAGSNINPLAREYSIGTLETGGSADVSFPIEISESAEATPRQLSFAVSYETRDGETRTTAPIKVQAPIEPDRDRFAVTAVNASVATGGSGTVAVEVTNNGDRTVSNVNAKLFANDPVTAEDDEAYIQSLAPGETTTVSFGVGIAGSAQPKTYPLSLDFQYDEDGDSTLSKTYQVPVTATASESGSGQFAVIGVAGAVLVVLALSYLWYRRR